MKKALKYFVAVLAAAAFCLALVACGESAGTKYIFKETKVTTTEMTDRETGATSEYTLPALESMYNTTYAGSTLEVKDGEIVWTIGDIENTMTYTMDGDKYLLAGDYIKQLNQGMGENGTITYYGQKTEEGYDLVMVETDFYYPDGSADNRVVRSITTNTFIFTAA